MAPAFELDEDGNSRLERRTAATEALSQEVIANPDILDSILFEQKAKKKDAEEEKKEAVKITSRYDKPRRINKVTLEIPLILESPQEESAQREEAETDSVESPSLPQLKLSKNTRCSLHCHVPPSIPNGRWTGSVSANSNVHKTVGSTSGTIDLTCKVSPLCRLIGGLGIATRATANPFHAHVGAQFSESKNDMIQITARQHANNSLGLHFLSKEVMDPWILTSNGYMNARTRDWSGMVTLTSMSTHVLRLGVGLTSSALSQAKTIAGLPLTTIQVCVDPKLSSNRRAPVSVQYQPNTGTWQGSIALQTCRPSDPSKPSIPSSWRVGIQQVGRSKTASLSSWSILVAWQHGDFTLRIPIILGTMAGMASAENQGLMEASAPYVLLAVYCSTVVGMANEMLTRVMWRNSANKSVSSSSRTIPEVKAKEDAEAQQRLMKRAAQTKKTTEEEKNGLVLRSAVYQCGDVSWDVTIPLLFWVNNDTSSLQLSAGSKADLLGFYPLTTTDNQTQPKQLEKLQSRVPWWQEYWTPTNRRKNKKKSAAITKATLTVEYLFKGEEFEVTIGDEEKLKLP